jgi:transcriptional regulator with XRE-family HTH domain
MRKSIIEIAGYDAEDPEILAAMADAETYAAFMAALVNFRRTSHLTQADVASIMGTKQSVISELESSTSNPRVRTLFKYARAVGSGLRFRTPVLAVNGFATARTASTAGNIQPLVAENSRAEFALAV